MTVCWPIHASSGLRELIFSPWEMHCNHELVIFELISRIDVLSISYKLSSGDCERAFLMICQHWFRSWLGAFRQQTITWANVDLVLCHHMASPGLNELKTSSPGLHYYMLSCFQEEVVLHFVWQWFDMYFNLMLIKNEYGLTLQSQCHCC